MKKLVVALLVLGVLAASAFAQSPTHKVVLTWNASSDAAANPTLAYRMYRAPSCSSPFVKIADIPAGTVTYTDSSVTPGSFCYVVTAVLNGAESAQSNTAPAVILPAAPAALSVSSSQ